jgi:peptidoglycan/LPS O-acetylase OafA/YrhL
MSGSSYRPEIDGLRAVALLAVMLFHADFEAFRGGFVGVDVFFVISGYLITSTILAERSAGTFSMRSFYERRARRILPALFLVALTCIPAAWVLLPPREMVDFSQSLSALPPFLSNVLFWRETGYFDTATELKPLIHTWSLAIEEQFYILYPLVLLAAWRIFERRTMVAVGIAALIGLLIAEWGARNSPSAAFFLLPFRAWEIATGALVAFYANDDRAPRADALVIEIGAVVGLALIVFAVLSFDRSTAFPGITGLVPVIGASLTIVCARRDNLTGSLLAQPVSVAIGLVSYSAYLFHQPLMAFARYAFQPRVLAMALPASIVLSLVLAFLSWKFVESPFRDPTLVSRTRLVAVTGTAGLALILVGSAGYLTDGFLSQRLSADRATTWRSIEVSPLRSQCHTGGIDFRSPERACEYFDGNLDTAVLGDSHAVELAYSLASALRPMGSKVLHLSFSSCAPSRGRPVRPDEQPCAKWAERALARINREESIRRVIVSFRINHYLAGANVAYPDVRPSLSQDERDAVWEAYLRTLQFLVANGKETIIVLQAPELPKNITSLVFDSRHSRGDISGVDKTWWLKRTEFLRSRVAQIPPEVRVIDPSNLFCDKRICFATKNGVALYFDDHHPSLSGARMVAQSVVKAMNEPEQRMRPANPPPN